MNELEKRSSRLTKIGRRVASIFIGLAVLAVLALLGLEGMDYIPDNALVYVDESKTYYSPPLLWDDSRPFYVSMPLEEVRTRGFRHVSRQPTSNREWDEVAQEFTFVWVYNKDKTWTEFRPRDGVCVIAVEKGTIKGKKGEYSPDRDHVNGGGFHGKSHSLILHLLRLNESRWNSDGSWKW
jgi:hypothetical protein